MERSPEDRRENAEPIPITILTAQGEQCSGWVASRTSVEIQAIVDGHLSPGEAVEVHLPSELLWGGVLDCTEDHDGYAVRIELLILLETKS